MPTRFNGPYYQFTAQAVSSTTVYTSPVTTVSSQHNIGLDVRFTGTMIGTLTIQGSNDGITFQPLTFSPPLSQPVGSALSYLVDLNNFPWLYLQTQYTNASGSGTLTSILSSKDLG